MHLIRLKWNRYLFVFSLQSPPTPVLTKAKGERPCYDQSIRVRTVSLNNISNGLSGFEEGQPYGRPVRHVFAHSNGVCY